jgi:LysM repeat protein
MPQERLIRFPATARSTGDQEPSLPSRRRDLHDADRATSPRRARRRRTRTPWLQRNALSVAAVSILVAVLGFGFGVLQLVNRPEPAPPALMAIGPPDSSNSGTVMTAAATGPSVRLAAGPALEASTSAPAAREARRDIRATASVLEPNYTIAAGDTLGQIAVRFNTSVDRIQALNNLVDPRALRIGTRLVIPPPF